MRTGRTRGHQLQRRPCVVQHFQPQRPILRILNLIEEEIAGTTARPSLIERINGCLHPRQLDDGVIKGKVEDILPLHPGGEQLSYQLTHHRGLAHTPGAAQHHKTPQIADLQLLQSLIIGLSPHPRQLLRLHTTLPPRVVFLQQALDFFCFKNSHSIPPAQHYTP